MKLVTRVLCSILLVSAVATSAFAGRPAPEKSQIPSGVSLKPMHVGLGGESATTACQLGVLGDPAWVIDYLLPPNDAYYTLINSNDCAGCPSGVIPTMAHIALEFRAGCAVSVVVGLYGAAGSAACYYPDLGNVLVAPTSYTVTPTAAGLYDLSFALPPAACINGPAFVMVKFMSVGCSAATYPRLVTTDGCAPCTSFNYYPGGADDLCDVGFPGNPLMWVDADCCAVVPTLPKSWGSLKVQYR